jgi:hypothetical protein
MEKKIKEKIFGLPEEIQVLFWIIRRDDLFNENIKSIFRSSLNWDHLRELLLNKGLLSLLYHRLKTLQMIIPNNIRQPIKDLYLGNVVRNIKLSNQLVELVGLFNTEGIQVFPFKGPVLSIQAYKDINIRYSADLDLMILNQDFDRVWGILDDQGFKPDSPMDSRVLKYVRKSWRDFHMAKDQLRLDIHQQIAKGPAFFRISPEVFRSPSKIQINDEEIATFSIEDTLVFLTIHAAKDGYQSLKLYRDITGLVENHPGIIWEKVFDRAKKMQSSRILLLGLKMAQELCGLTLPPRVHDRILGNKSVEWLYDFFITRLISSKIDLPILDWYLSIPKALDTTWSKLKFYLWFACNPSPQVHFPANKPPGPFLFLRMIFHPIFMIFKYGKSIFWKKK